jgi:hypothetical protein
MEEIYVQKNLATGASDGGVDAEKWGTGANGRP